MISIIILVLVFVGITLRRFIKVKFEIWQIMSLGAILNLIFFEITPYEAIKAVDWNVIFFLFCMFSVGALLEISGYLEIFQNKILLKSKRNIDFSLYLFIFISAFLSAFFMNDTIAIIGVPIMISIFKGYNTSPRPFIIALAFAITIGSVLSPIGNPQNLIIAITSRMPNPFFVFLKYLFIPTIINLLLLFWIIKYFYKKELSNFSQLQIKRTKIKNIWLYYISHLTVALLFALIIIKIYFSINGKEFSLIYIAVMSSIPALFLSFKQHKILKMVDFKTLLFFISMFIVTRSAWNSGYIQKLILNSNFDFLSLSFIFLSSIILSQFISNVPLVALYIPIFMSLGAGEKSYIALAASSTIAGNLSLLGAASNIIIVQNLENRKYESISSIEFIKIGTITTFLNALVYYIFIKHL
ncbi:MAG: anion transporter [Elusimicrobiota bacterium]